MGRNPDLINALVATLQSIEASEQLAHKDPRLENLKRFILLHAADLEREEIADSTAA